MSDASTIQMIDMYMEEASAPMFLSGFFQSPARNFHNTEKVEIDVIRDDEDIAVPVQDIGVSGRQNESNKYVNKSFTPPIFKEEGPIKAYDSLHRVPGQDPFADVDFGRAATSQAFQLVRKLERKIRRSVELMAAQALQTGVLSLKDDGGSAIYTLDFKAKSANHATVSVTWAADGSAGTPIEDVEAQCRVIRRNGGKSPTRLIFGSTAWNRWLANSKVRDNFRTDAFAGNLGMLAPTPRGEGATMMGWVRVGAYLLEMWLYEVDYKDPQSGTLTPYIDPEKVLIMGEGRLDLTFGGVPALAPPDATAMSFLPDRMGDMDLGLDLHLCAWLTNDRRSLQTQAMARPLTIPTAIDTVGTLDITA